MRLRRALGPGEVTSSDPFLLLDDFSSDDPSDYLAGFPWHPHRGIETVTYMIRGEVEHGDSIGNKGVIGSGDVQWMTAGSGILHQEMPREFKGMMQGFQLWINLPASSKMMSPRYREIKADAIPTHSPDTGVEIKIVAGAIGGTKGPVKDLVVDAEYVDVSIAPNRQFEHAVRRGNTGFAYIFQGDGRFDGSSKKSFGQQEIVMFGEGDSVSVKAGPDGVRFLMISGSPLKEPVAWGGPIVMNTDAELDLAFGELREGNFIKGRKLSPPV